MIFRGVSLCALENLLRNFERILSTEEIGRDGGWVIFGNIFVPFFLENHWRIIEQSS